MTQDYPDWTNMVNIIGTDIMIAMDIQGSMIMVPVDIQAQYVDLDINIKAQDVTIDIDIDAQSVGVYLQADWAALQGTDKTFTCYDYDTPWGGGGLVTYGVPAGKTLFITSANCSVRPKTAEDFDHFFNAMMLVGWQSPETWLATLGGIGGCSASFPKPLVIEGGKTLLVYVYNFANLLASVRGAAYGYEV